MFDNENSWIKRIKDNSSIVWILILLAILFISNYLLFILYTEANPHLNFYNQLWNFFESTGFKVVSISLILPIIMFAFEIIFKIRERVADRKDQIQKEIYEFNKKDKEEHRQQQMQSIIQTQNVWKELITLSSQLSFYEENCGTTIEEIRIKLDKFIISAEDVVISWFLFSKVLNNLDHKFKKLYPDLKEPNDIQNTLEELKPILNEKSLQDCFITPLNFLSKSANAVAQYIQDNPEKNEMRMDLQLALRLIEGYIKNQTHYFLIDILNKVVIYEYYEDSSRRKEAFNKIVQNLKSLNNWSTMFNHMISENDKVMAFVKDDKNLYVQLQSLADELQTNWKKEPKKSLQEFENYEKFEELYQTIPLNERLQTKNFSYEFIINTADIIALDFLVKEIQGRAGNQNIYEKTRFK